MLESKKRILIVDTGIIPVRLYGGTERVIWGLGKELVKMGHDVTFLVKEGSSCDWAKVLYLDESKAVVDQIRPDYDVVHFNFQPPQIEGFSLPYVITMHGNRHDQSPLDRNTIFVSRNHAERFGSTAYVHNGLDWTEYTLPDFELRRKHFHFLGKAAWRVKNVQGAIDIVNHLKGARLEVLGGVRFNLKMGLRFTFSPKISFKGMVGGAEKYQLLNSSKGLLFPVRWHEPFGLALTESLYYGCPVFGTPYGSLPEIVTTDVGFLSNQSKELELAILQNGDYNPRRCHEYAVEEFNSKKMALAYLSKYNIVLEKGAINPERPKLKEIQSQKFLEWS